MEEVRFPGHELQLVVGDLEDVALGEAPGDLRSGFVELPPERGPEVRVKGDERAALPGEGQRLPRRAAAGLVRQG